MVLSEELERAAAVSIAAAVADVDDPESIGWGVLEQQRDQGGAHAVQGGRFAGVTVDRLVGGADGVAGAGVGVVRGIGRGGGLVRTGACCAAGYGLGRDAA